MSISTLEPIYRKQVLEEVDRVPVEHLPSLLKMLRAFRESVAMPSAEDSFRQGWQEMLRGELYPVSELWSGVDDV